MPDLTKCEIGSWNGYKQYRCKFVNPATGKRCAYDTFYEPQFDVHYYQVHERPRELQQVPMRATLFDARGNVITHRDPTETEQ